MEEKEEQAFSPPLNLIWGLSIRSKTTNNYDPQAQQKMCAGHGKYHLLD